MINGVPKHTIITMTQEPTYTEAFEELEKIVREMEQVEISIDQLDQRLKRAAYLVKLCREKLYETEKNVQEILEDMDTPPEK